MKWATTKGYREDLDVWFRSRWEANLARLLKYLVDKEVIVSWKYEPQRFWFKKITRGTMSYLPDFKIELDGKAIYIEIKGYMTTKGKTALRRMKKFYPTVEVILLNSKEYNAFERRFSWLFPNWEYSRESLKKKAQDKRNKIIQKQFFSHSKDFSKEIVKVFEEWLQKRDIRHIKL